MVVMIPITGGGTALVDDEDGPLVNRYKWQLYHGYAIRVVCKPSGHRGTVRMHRVVTRCPAGMEVDHINGDTLDNRRCNLRIVTHRQNMQNRCRDHITSATGFRNVYLRKPQNTYRVSLQVNGVTVNVGSYQQLDDAVVASINARRRYFTHSYEQGGL